MKNLKDLLRVVRLFFKEWYTEPEKVVSLESSDEAPRKKQPVQGNKPVVSVPKATEAMLQMEEFLENQLNFRFNQLTEVTEYRWKSAGSRQYYPVNQRELNSFCIAARKDGIDCWDRDISRYIYSGNVPEYHPFHLFMRELPVWDGIDRVNELARRVSGTPLWIMGFHRWMLALVSQWLEMDQLHANSVAPLLVSRKQGKQKSTFCKMLLPQELQSYYTDSFDISAQSGAERKLMEFGLINLDEFDKFSPRKMSLLKNLMQMAGLNIRKAHQKSYRSLPRIASFIGTSNQKELLCDSSGSRRFLCVEIEETIDCSAINHSQIYAQLKAELAAGERYWFSSDEESEIKTSNAAFYKHPVEEEIFYACFRPAEADEAALSLSASEIFRHLKKHNPSAMSGASAANFGKVLTALGLKRRHTEFGNVYLLRSYFHNPTKQFFYFDFCVIS